MEIKSFFDMTQELEAHYGQKFDYQNRRHRSALEDKVNRQTNKLAAIVGRVRNVLDGSHTYDATKYRLSTIPESQR